jgi:hypothetical protein
LGRFSLASIIIIGFGGLFRAFSSDKDDLAGSWLFDLGVVLLVDLAALDA